MLSRGELVLQRFVLRTRTSPLRHVYRALYGAVAGAAAAWMGRGGSTVYLTGSLANGEPLYGLSDIDLIGVAPAGGRAQLARSVERMHRVVPLLARLAGDVYVYDQPEFAAAISSPFLTYGLGGGRAAFTGGHAAHDPAALLERPGLHGPRDGWRRVRGPEIAAAGIRERHDERIAAWLELQLRWRFAYLTCLDEPDFALGPRVGSLVAEAARIWLWLAANEKLTGRRAPLQRATGLLEDEAEPLRLALRTLEPRSSQHPGRELWACFVRLSRRIAQCIEDELASSTSTEVQLDGDCSGRGMPLRDWRALVLPAVDWSTPGLPAALPEYFTLGDEDPTDLDAVARAARSTGDGHWRSLRSGPLLARPTLRVWEDGRLRGLETPASDPVSFALADGRASAAFPDVRGWSALDRSRRAVAEHRAWLHQELDGRDRRPGWVGPWPSASWETPASVSLLLSAARAALFLESVERGAARLPLTEEATVRSLTACYPSTTEVAEHALAALRASERERRPPGWVPLMRLRAAVIRLPAYATADPERTT